MMMKLSFNQSRPHHIFRCIRDARGTALIEFAFAAPILIGLYFASYQITDAIAAQRKVTLTARNIADLVAQTGRNTTLTTANLDTFLNASAATMAPYSNSTLVLTISEVCVPAKGWNNTTGALDDYKPGFQTLVVSNSNTAVYFSRTINDGTLQSGLNTVPSNYVPDGFKSVANATTEANVSDGSVKFATNGVCYIISKANFTYSSPTISGFLGSIPMSAQFITVPRNVQQIPLA